ASRRSARLWLGRPRSPPPQWRRPERAAAARVPRRVCSSAGLPGTHYTGTNTARVAESEDRMALTAQANDEIIISADSHVSEDPEFWVKELPARFRDSAPRFAARRVSDDGGRFGEKPGGWDSAARLQEMATDGVSAEVLYPTFGLRLFGLDDAEL